MRNVVENIDKMSGIKIIGIVLGCFSALCFLVFSVFKLTAVVEWPWIWVASPIWIGICLYLFAMWVELIIFDGD